MPEQTEAVTGGLNLKKLQFYKELARIHGKSSHLAKCSQLFKKSF